MARSIPFGEIPLTDYLRRWAALQPDKAAVIFYGAVMSYAELDRLSDRFAALLVAHGVAPGEAVCVFLQNCPQYHVAFYGILKAGAIHAPVSPMSKALELGHQGARQRGAGHRGAGQPDAGRAGHWRRSRRST